MCCYLIRPGVPAAARSKEVATAGHSAVQAFAARSDFPSGSDKRAAECLAAVPRDSPAEHYLGSADSAQADSDSQE